MSTTAFRLVPIIFQHLEFCLLWNFTVLLQCLCIFHSNKDTDKHCLSISHSNKGRVSIICPFHIATRVPVSIRAFCTAIRIFISKHYLCILHSNKGMSKHYLYISRHNNNSSSKHYICILHINKGTNMHCPFCIVTRA